MNKKHQVMSEHGQMSKKHHEMNEHAMPSSHSQGEE